MELSGVGVAEEQDKGASSGSGPQGADPASLSLSLSGADRDEANAFLRKQGRLADLQMEEMRAEEPYKLSHYRLRRFSGWARVALEISLGLIALGVIAVLGFTVWKAAHSEGLIIESFRVPPDLAARGLTGEVLADQVLDRLTAMQAATNSGVANQSYSGGSGDDIKVEIPETGISIGELYRFLRRWLGHETHISGEMVRSASAAAV